MLRAPIHLTTRILGTLAAIFLLAMVLLMTLDVIRRELTGRAIPGVVDYSEILMIGLVYCGIAYAQSTDSHINVVIVSSRLPRRLAAGVFSVGMVLVCLVVAWFFVEAGDHAIQSTLDGESRFGIASVPVWPARVILALGVLALLLELLIKTFDAIKATATGARLETIHGQEAGVEQL